MGLACSCLSLLCSTHDAKPSSQETEHFSFFFSPVRSLCWPRTSKSGRRSDTVSTTDNTGNSSNTLRSDHYMKSDVSSISYVTEESDISRELILPSELRKFTFAELKTATRNFRPDSILGEGGFGCVFKAWINEHGTAPAKPGSGLAVAVKILNTKGVQGHKEWMAEVILLGQLHHPNLVKLVGFCIEDEQRLLVYEYMQRGSLENHLLRKRVTPLPWNTRMKIAFHAAKGVDFLHSRKNPIIYRDLKTSNILLDEEFQAKLSDFGLAKDGPKDNKSHVSTQVMGTCGYAAPEYVMTGHLSFKSDVYSFGVVLLEILTGKRSIDENRPNGEEKLVPWARPYLNDKKKLIEIIDPRLEGRYPINGATKLAQLVYRCLNRDPALRPTMHIIVRFLEQLQE